MQSDEDVILYLKPAADCSEPTLRVIRHKANASRYVGIESDQFKLTKYDERAQSEPPAPDGQDDTAEYIVLRFSDGARTSSGIICGWHKDADVLFESRPGVSRFHVAITFDEAYRPVARDLGGTYGPIVIYNGQFNRRCKAFDWPLTGSEIWKNGIQLFICKNIRFQVIVPKRDTTSALYRSRVDKFRQGTTAANDLLGLLRIQSEASTQVSNTPQTETQTPDAFEAALAEGAFGAVSYVFDLATRDEYVVKRPLKKSPVSWWKKEADIMRVVSHEHIVKFLGAKFDPTPELKFEYIPGGSLDAQTELTTYENAQILHQSSLALNYLHTQKPPIAHRDVKPANILVAKRNSSGILVKFADFGLAKVADELRTFVGSPLYLAPEVDLMDPRRRPEGDSKYDKRADIWSLGATIADLECGLPHYGTGEFWVDTLRDHVFTFIDSDDDLLSLVYDSMLVADADERSSADYIAVQAQRIWQEMPDNLKSSCRSSSVSRALVNTIADSGSTSEASTIRANAPSGAKKSRATGHGTKAEQDTSGAEKSAAASVVHAPLWNCSGVEEFNDHSRVSTTSSARKRGLPEDLVSESQKRPPVLHRGLGSVRRATHGAQSKE